MKTGKWTVIIIVSLYSNVFLSFLKITQKWKTCVQTMLTYMCLVCVWEIGQLSFAFKCPHLTNFHRTGHPSSKAPRLQTAVSLNLSVTLKVDQSNRAQFETNFIFYDSFTLLSAWDIIWGSSEMWSLQMLWGFKICVSYIPSSSSKHKQPQD